MRTSEHASFYVADQAYLPSSSVTTRGTVFMFSGQGAQYFGMGQAVFERDPVFRRWMLELDAQASRRLGFSIVDLLYHGGHRKMDPFERLMMTHPAIFMVEYAMASALHGAGLRADAVLAASMGAFAAAAFAGYLGVELALELVIDQAEIVEQTCGAGGMLAVLADVELFHDAGLDRLSAFAGKNSAAHFIVAGPTQALAEVEAILRARQVTFQRLPVPFAFHSAWIDVAREPMLQRLSAPRAGTAEIRFICCAYQMRLDILPDDYFWNACRMPIEFQQTMTRLDADGPYRYIDVGPAGTLATLAKYALGPDTAFRMFPTMSPFGNDLERIEQIHLKSRPHSVSP
ncbi:acyltransferase domain-containing protein [Burkholderia gladioli]|uniref:acyltransferase domain-containing protein n=1 Tax=Burkholderia gladioli TaxID=28095 RepID=UPI001360B2E5|nr:acyltransferase domain-containing protein [Burkholderia gladioli]MBW5285062.1 acyltransferase domain-containing protein [Burkholderia gladioli]